MRLLLVLLVSGLFASAAAFAAPKPELVQFFSFEQDFQGWSVGGYGQIQGDSATPSQDHAKDGVWSVKISESTELGGFWIQRPFTLQG